MPCTHDAIKCTNNVFFCLKCGAVVPNPFEGKEQEGQKENATERPVKAAKRKPKTKAD